jgi:hypothetical protein
MERRNLACTRCGICTLVFALLVVPSTACIVIPLPRVTPQVGPKRIEQVEVGMSSKREVRSLLQKPTVELSEDIWVYNWFTRKMNLLVAVPGGGDVDPVGVRNYRALARFD